MIGDLVQHPNHMGNLVLCRIVGISTDITVEFGKDIRMYEALEFAQPIPLTNEILEKNGFVKRKANFTPNWCRYVLTDNFFLEDRLKDAFHFNGSNILKFKFVHELQHALKLCGIEKEIKI